MFRVGNAGKKLVDFGMPKEALQEFLARHLTTHQLVAAGVEGIGVEKKGGISHAWSPGSPRRQIGRTVHRVVLAIMPLTDSHSPLGLIERPL